MRIQPLPLHPQKVCRSGLSLAAGLALFVTSLPAVGQEVPRGLGDLNEIVDVTVVNVDVWATDRKGNPVDDLSVEDFRLFDDKRKVDITHFLKPSDLESSDRERLTLVVFVDNLHVSSTSRNALVPALRASLGKRLDGPDVHGMVVAFDGRGLRILQDLTSDRATLLRGLNSIELADDASSATTELERFSQNTLREALSLSATEGYSAAVGRASLQQTFSQLRIVGDLLYDETGRTLDALTALLDSLALVPGRKALFYVGDGLPSRPLDIIVESFLGRAGDSRNPYSEDLTQPPEYDRDRASPAPSATGNAQAGDSSLVSSGLSPLGDQASGRLAELLAAYDLSERFERLAAQANANRVTFYSVKPAPVDASRAALGRHSQAPDAVLNELSDVDTPMARLTARTGGESMVIGSDAAAFLDSVDPRHGAYYSLGFVPEPFIEGSLHDLRVKSRRRGVRLRYAENYLAKSLESRVVERTTGALLLGWSENPHEIRIATGDVTQSTGSSQDVGVVLEVPLGSLELVSDGSYRVGQVRAVIAILTEEKEQLDPHHAVIPLRIPESDWQDAKDQAYGVEMRFVLPRGTHKVAAGLWDEGSGRGSFIRQDLSVR